jgi:HAD superfamily hydrolase (TIGR01509 family)
MPLSWMEECVFLSNCSLSGEFGGILRCSLEFMIKGFIFDVDGTLIDSMNAHLESWIGAFSRFGRKVTKEEVKEYFGKRADQVVLSLSGERLAKGLIEKIIIEKRRLYRSRIAKIKAIPGATELLAELRARGLKIGLATSAQRVELDFYIKNLFGEENIDYAVAGEEVARSKPNPDLIFVLLQKMNLQKHEVALVGDSPHDMLAANRAGIKAIAVLTGGYKREELLKAGASLIFKNIQELRENIESLLEK